MLNTTKHRLITIMNHRERIQKLVDHYPKLFSQMISRDSDLLAEISHTEHTEHSISESVYRYLNNVSDVICENGNRLKFRNFRDGYGFCGRPNVCACAKSSISESVRLKKSTVTTEQQEKSNARRVATNLKKYGVENAGQTETAKQRHRAVYADSERSEKITQQVKATKQEKYGDTNYNNREQIRKTWNDRKQQYMEERFPEKHLGTLYDPDQLAALFENHTPYQIAELTNTSVTTVFRHLASHGLRDPYRSTLEQEMRLFLMSQGVTNIMENSRSVIPSGKELDLYLPDHNLAIEMNGIYWHHEGIPHIHKHYHRQKFLDCESQGIQLITVFSDDWEQKRDVVENLISHKLGFTQHHWDARKLTVRMLKSRDVKQFLITHHIQGYAPASECLALCDDDDIVAVMTFSKPRSGIGKHRPHTWELVRYASSGSVRGGASRLLTHFIRRHPEIQQIVSYSNNEYSQGQLYRTLGFDLESDLPASYFYYCPKENRRYHRYNFAKHKLVEQGFDSSLTETQIQTQRGYLKIWDTGKRTWVLCV